MRFLVPLFVTPALLIGAEQLTFLKDVMPVINKAGCTSGPCHGAAKGKNGFKLSLRGYDPEFDYEALLYDLSGRRFNRADPARSLMLAKPTMEVPHGGGLRFEKDSRYYKIILEWLRTGAPFGDPAKDKVVKLEVSKAEFFFDQPGAKEKIRTTAHYADGATRDVTAEASVSSNTPDIAEVNADSVIETKRKGEAALLVRYEGKFVTVPLTVLNPKQGFTWAALPQYNYVDQLIDAKLKKLHIQPSGLASDAEFLRRVSLDLVGVPPTPKELRAFLAEPGDAKTKRARAIDALMKRASFVDHWTVKWGDLLQNSRRYLGDKATWGFREWIRDSIASNKPYDKMVRELLTSRGSAYENPAANYYRVMREPKLSMEKTSQVFLGVRMVCAQCHDHPFEQWTQNQYYQLSAFFAAVGLKPGYETGDEILYLKRDDNLVKHPKTGRTVEPQYLIASIGAPPIPQAGDRREALAEWLTSKNNPFFAKAIVNRMWSYFFGKGIIDPVDDIRASNPPVNEALLTALTKDFVERGFDLHHLIRTIVNSRAYQASIDANEWNEDDHINFSHQMPRRLSAEQLQDALFVATGSRPHFPEVPEDTLAQQLPDPHVGKDGFLDLFGRPQRESACECERRTDLSLPQALNLVNGGDIATAIGDPKGAIAKLITAGATDRQLIEELYLGSLSRLPSPAEYDHAVTFLKKGDSRAARAQDLLWALVNSKGFLFNR
ncbi:MAG: DUF1549 domain-containing protein [Acidobacteria bacterium]|nr:DUF1549 domain-containing protein [Acidobacteriota bacterium]